MFRKVMLGVIVGALAAVTLVGSFGMSSHSVSAQSNQSMSAIAVERSEGSSVAHGLVERIEISWPWYLTRASGMVAAGALVILLLSGVGLVTGQTFSFLEPLTAWASHRALGIALAVAGLLHVGSLYFDHFVPFSILSLLVPLVSSYKAAELFGISVGSLWVALGVLALYVSAAIVITSLLWIEKMPKLWKVTHLLSYMAILFVFVHGLYLGTDLADGLLRWLWISAALVVVYASFVRLWRVRTV